MSGERALLHEWRFTAWALALGLLLVSFWSHWNGGLDGREWLKNMVPEFLGAALIALFLQWLSRDDDRKKYVNAMMSIRRSVAKQGLSYNNRSS